MKTKHDVTLDRLVHWLDRYVEADAKKGRLLGERLQRGAKLLRDGAVKRVGPHDYEVQSGTAANITYAVNGSCSCPDAKKVWEGWCKHRIAVRLYRWVEADLLELQRNGIPHDYHKWDCDAHRDLDIQCWQQACPDQITVHCEVCAKLAPAVAVAAVEAQPVQEEDIFEQEPETVAEMLAKVEPDDGWQDFVGETADHDDPPATEVVTAVPDCQEIPEEPAGEATSPEPPDTEELPPLVYTVPQYEPAPVLEVKPEALPEAAVSLCLSIKIDRDNGITYTMRGHDDASVLERLPQVLATVERLLHTEDEEAGFFTRLARAFFPAKRGAYGK